MGGIILSMTTTHMEETVLASTSRSQHGVTAALTTFDDFDVITLTSPRYTDDGVRSNVVTQQFDCDGGGHTDVSIHGAVALEICEDEAGPSIVVRTATGYNVRIGLFGRVIDGERQPVVITR